MNARSRAIVACLCLALLSLTLFAHAIVRLPTTRSTARSIAAIDGNRAAGSAWSARSSTVRTDCVASGRISCNGGTPTGGGVSPVSIAKQIAASCH